MIGTQAHFVRWIACVALLLATFAPAHADDTVKVYNPAVLPGETAAQCYTDATEHLRKGEWFERAINQLKEAIRQDPKNGDYHLALGCAYADRAASIGYAGAYSAAYNDDVVQYQKSLGDWEKAQSDPTNYEYHTDKPIPPADFTPYTKDDLAVFALTTDQVKAKLVALSKEAQSEWTQAIALAKSPADRANAEYVQGWGIDMLATYKGALDDFGFNYWNQPPHVIDGLPTDDDAAKSFKSAIKVDPKNATYWQSLGDALGPPDTREPDPSDASANQVDPATHGIPSLAAYRQSLKINPKNALLWWYIAEFEVATDPTKAADDLKQAIVADPTNAYPMYVLAQAYLKQTRYINNYIENSDVDHKDFAATEQVDKNMAASLTDQDRKLAHDAIQLVEQGNGAQFCRYPMYHPPVPALLLPAFDFMYRVDFLFPSYAEQRALARDLCGYADVAAINGDLTTAYDVDSDIVAMGKRVIGDWTPDDNWRAGHVLIGQLVGMAIASIGYSNMVRIAQHYGDEATAEAVQEESDAFKAQDSAWRHALMQGNIIDQDMYANY